MLFLYQLDVKETVPCLGVHLVASAMRDVRLSQLLPTTVVVSSALEHRYASMKHLKMAVLCCVSCVHLSYSLYEKPMVIEPEEVSSGML